MSAANRVEVSRIIGAGRPGRELTLWQRWLHRPQSVWVRKAVFQIHLWLGIGVGLYVVMISISGSAIVYRHDIGRNGSHKRAVASLGRPRMGIAQVEQSAQRAYPAYEVLSVTDSDTPDQADSVILERRNQRIERLFDPYTGRDLGDPRSRVDRVIGWLANLHDNLLFGLTGRIWNGIGSLLITLLSLTGAVIWWPGIKSWRRSITVSWSTRFARLNWDLHSAVGFWCSLFVLIWGISGICLCFPGAFDFLIGGQFRPWITRLHFGRFNGLTEALWTVLGLAPAVLAVTGALMWWNRVLSKKIRHSRM